MHNSVVMIDLDLCYLTLGLFVQIVRSSSMLDVKVVQDKGVAQTRGKR